MSLRFKIIGSNDCKYCIMALDFITKNLPQAEKEYFDYTKNPEALKILRDSSYKTVPQIWVTDTDTQISLYIGGYNELIKWIQSIDPEEQNYSLDSAMWYH